MFAPCLINNVPLGSKNAWLLRVGGYILIADKAAFGGGLTWVATVLSLQGRHLLKCYIANSRVQAGFWNPSVFKTVTVLVTKSAVHGDLLGVIGFTSRHTFRCVETAVFLSVTQGLLVSGRSPTRESPPWMYLPKAQQPENSTIDWCLWWSLGEEPLGRGKCRWDNLKKVKVYCLINEVHLIPKRGSWVGIWMQGEGIKRYISRKARDACLECGKDHVHQFELRSSTSKKTNPRIGWKESMNFVDRKTTVSCKTCAFTQSMEQWFVCVVISTISLCTYTWDQGNHPWMK